MDESPGTQVRFFKQVFLNPPLAIAVLVAALAAPDVFADGASDAQATLSKAYNDYTHALQNKPGFTPEDRARLSKQILAPAQASANRSIDAQAKKPLDYSKAPALLN